LKITDNILWLFFDKIIRMIVGFATKAQANLAGEIRTELLYRGPEIFPKRPPNSKPKNIHIEINFLKDSKKNEQYLRLKFHHQMLIGFF
jgi:hypothetical protein